jgi:hypothetical protein
VDVDAIEGLRERHAAWRLLRAGNTSLVLSFVEEDHGATPAGRARAGLAAGAG